MLKLKHLFHDQSLALSILSNWEYDADEPHLMERFRISANAVYPFRNRGGLQFLRFAPADEKTAEAILSELDFLRYLRKHDYPCLTAVLSRQGNELEVVETSKGRYHAVAFGCVPGKSLEPEHMTDQVVHGWGKAMGRLHRLSAGYRPAGPRRIDYLGQLEWMADVLAGFPDEHLARQEVRTVFDWLSTLPKNESNFGLIHYDFETDNVFHDETTGRLHAIDFDDAVYHWFMMDLTTALMSYKADAPEGRFESAKEQFIAGYRTEHELSDDLLTLMPGFIRYQSLYAYVRVLRSTHEKLTEEPDWMLNLRKRLDQALVKRGAEFGKPILTM